MPIISYKILITFLQKMLFFARSSYKKCDVLFQPQFQKSSNYQQQQPQLPFTLHKLSQDPSKSAQIVNFEQEEFTCTFTPKIIIMYSSYETPDKKSENSQLMMIGKCTWYQMKIQLEGFLTVLTQTCCRLLWWRKSLKKRQNHLCSVILKTIKTLKILAKFNHRFHFFPSPLLL